jgi:glutathione S-transferase
VILIGRYRSPFTRRVAISMRLLGFSYEHRAYTAWSNLSEVRAVNPVGRVPALILDSGEALFDSGAILDYLDRLVGPQSALVPAEEPERRRVLRIAACAMGVLEKVVAALYARTMYPPEKVHQPWIEHNQSQARCGLQWLDALEPAAALAGGALTQAEVTTMAMYDFTRLVNPQLVPDGAYPRLDALAAHCREIPAFRDTRPVSSADQADPTLAHISG